MVFSSPMKLYFEQLFQQLKRKVGFEYVIVTIMDIVSEAELHGLASEDDGHQSSFDLLSERI